MMNHLIRVYHYGTVTREEQVATKKEAKRIYMREGSLYSQYAEVVLNGSPMVTAQAERYFGIKGTYSQQAWGPKEGK